MITLDSRPRDVELKTPIVLTSDDLFGKGFVITDPIIKLGTKKNASLQDLLMGFPLEMAIAPQQPFFVSTKAIREKIIPALPSGVGFNVGNIKEKDRIKINISINNSPLQSSYVIQDHVMDIENHLDGKDASIFDVGDLQFVTRTETIPFAGSIYYQPFSEATFATAITLRALRAMAADYGKMMKITNTEGDILIVKNENLSKTKFFKAASVAGLVILHQWIARKHKN